MHVPTHVAVIILAVVMLFIATKTYNDSPAIKAGAEQQYQERKAMVAKDQADAAAAQNQLAAQGRPRYSLESQIQNPAAVTPVIQERPADPEIKSITITRQWTVLPTRKGKLQLIDVLETDVPIEIRFNFGETFHIPAKISHANRRYIPPAKCFRVEVRIADTSVRDTATYRFQN